MGVGKLGVKDGGCVCCLTVNYQPRKKLGVRADSVPLFLENLALRVVGKVCRFVYFGFVVNTKYSVSLFGVRAWR